MRTGRYIATNVTLSQLVRDAYGVQEFQIANQPGWFDAERFDVEAIMAAGAKQEDAQLMLQALLADRFKLAFHREQRPAGVYALVVAKDGPKLTKADPSKCSNTTSGCGFNASPTQIVGTSVSMGQLAFRLSRSLGRFVTDDTGLDGRYDLKVEWPRDNPFTEPGASASASIFAALQDQLGLRLESRRAPVETLAIDRAERPTEN
jgi:uncharacterized protein (TIGR03435 family)